MIFAGATASFSNDTCILIDYFPLDEKKDFDLLSGYDFKVGHSHLWYERYNM